MRMLEVIILGAVQGIAEFLPISSSAHLIIFRNIFGIGSFITGKMDLVFDLSLHFGTILAIIIFFFNELLTMIKRGLNPKEVHKKGGNLLWLIVVASIPAAIFGVLFDEFFEDIFRNNFILISFGLIFMGILLYIFDKDSKTNRSINDLTYKDAIIIGISQVLALIPGFSRSGTTISAARYLKLNREDAAKFSFFLSLPVVLGACLLKLLKASTWSLIMSNLSIFIVGIITSFVVGVLTIKVLLKYLDNHNFKVFMIYRIILAAIVLLCVIF